MNEIVNKSQLFLLIICVNLNGVVSHFGSSNNKSPKINEMRRHQIISCKSEAQT